jgi:hypothetical protein
VSVVAVPLAALWLTVALWLGRRQARLAVIQDSSKTLFGQGLP